MANCCTTDYVFIGPKSQLENFVGELHKRTFHRFRGTITYIPEKEDIISSYIHPDLYNISLQTETAWRAMNESWDKILKQFPGVSYVYFEQEPGLRIYITNDLDCEFFPWSYWVNIHLDSEADPDLYEKYAVLDGGEPGFEEDEFLDTFRDILGDSTLTADDIVQLVKQDFASAAVSCVEINKIKRLPNPVRK